MFPPRFSSCGGVKICCPILHRPGHICIILETLQFCIRIIIIGLVSTRVSQFYGEVWNVLVLHVAKGVVVKVDHMFAKETYSIIDSG